MGQLYIMVDEIGLDEMAINHITKSLIELFEYFITYIM